MPTVGSLKTYFAPAGRVGSLEFGAAVDTVNRSMVIQALLQAVDGYVMVLNAQRQVLATNLRLLKDLGADGCHAILGARPGEILRCVHADEGPDGCGTSRACAHCGAVLSILASRKSAGPSEHECLLTLKDPDGGIKASEFSVRATSCRIAGHDLTVLVLHDISAQKRKAVLEQAFFHDIRNTLAGIHAWSFFLGADEQDDPKEVARNILLLAERLTQEIDHFRVLVQAEESELKVNLWPVPIERIFDELEAVLHGRAGLRSQRLVIQKTLGAPTIETDPVLLGRILTNMVLNGFEASAANEPVTVWFESIKGKGVFHVHNVGTIPDAVAPRIFQRSFSTKADAGRGIGTYTMKLLGEKYLGGRVGFRSDRTRGTEFFIELPA